MLPQREMGFQSDDQSRPGDVFAPSWSRNRPTAFGVTITYPLAESKVGDDASDRCRIPGSAAEDQRDLKLRRCAAACRRQGVDFVPLAVESFGGWADMSLQALREIARRAADRKGGAAAKATQRLLRRLSVILQRANGHLLLTGSSPFA